MVFVYYDDPCTTCFCKIIKHSLNWFFINRSLLITPLIIYMTQFNPYLNLPDCKLYFFRSWWRTAINGTAKPLPKKRQNHAVNRYLFEIWKGRFWKVNEKWNIILAIFIKLHQLKVCSIQSIKWQKKLTCPGGGMPSSGGPCPPPRLKVVEENCLTALMLLPMSDILNSCFQRYRKSNNITSNSWQQRVILLY